MLQEEENGKEQMGRGKEKFLIEVLIVKALFCR